MPRVSYDDRADRFDAEVAAAAASNDSDNHLIELLRRPGLDELERITVVAALGESGASPAGTALVRAQFSDAMANLATSSRSKRFWWRDLACAAVIALARREGPAATDVYLSAAMSANQDLRSYGLETLYAEGDDLAWDPMLAKAAEIISHKPISWRRWEELLQAVSYLIRHAAADAPRAELLVTLLRANWGVLARPPRRKVGQEAESLPRLEEIWPGIQPDGPPAAALGLPRLPPPIAWWKPGYRPPKPGEDSSGA